MHDLPDISHLTMKEQAIIKGVLTGKSNTQAYKDAGYSQKGSNQDMATQAKRILNKPHIIPILTTFQLRNAEKIDMSVETHLKELSELASDAKGLEQYGAAIRATELKGKVAGHYVDRVAIERVDPVQDALQVVCQELESTLGPDIARAYAREKGIEWLPSRDTAIEAVEYTEVEDEGVTGD